MACLREHGANVFVPLELTGLSTSLSTPNDGNGGGGDSSSGSDIPTYATTGSSPPAPAQIQEASMPAREQASTRRTTPHSDIGDIPGPKMKVESFTVEKLKAANARFWFHTMTLQLRAHQAGVPLRCMTI